MGKDPTKKKASKYTGIDEETVNYPPEKLDRKSKDLEKLLLLILLDYLIGTLNKAETLRRGLSLIEEHFDALIEEVTQFYKGKGLSGEPSTKEIKARKAKIRAEFERLIDSEEPYWKSREGLTQGAMLMAIWAAYSASAAVAESVARAEGATLVWRSMGDIHVCEACLELEDTIYGPGDVVPPMPLHENCRCWWEIWVK